MKKYSFLLLTFNLSLLTFFTGCATTKQHIKATSPNTEVVEAEGFAPIINNDIIGAKKASLSDALKNALGLVVGVYVSGEALVSKAITIEDNITSQTEGYIEKYEVLKEWREGDFYKTKIRALVRKEDIAAKIKALELEPQRLGNPLVTISVNETIDGKLSDTKFAESELKKKFIDAGFIVSEEQRADISVEGNADANFYTDQGLGGMISYRASLSVKALKTGSNDIVATAQNTSGGLDITKQAAAKKSLLNCAQMAGETLSQSILKYLREKSTVQLMLSNVKNINRLNDIMRSIRALIEVRDCWVRNYSEGVATIELSLKRGKTSDVANRLEQLVSVKIKVTKTSAYSITAEVVNK